MELINVPSLPLHKPQVHGTFMQGGYHAPAAASPPVMFPSCMLGLNHGGGNGNHVEHQNIIKNNNSNNSSSSNSNACINPMPAAQGPMSVLDAAFAAAGPPPPLVSSPRDDQMVPCASYNTPWGTSLTVSDHMDMGINAYLMPHQQPQPPAATVRTSTGQQQPPPRIEHHASNTKSPDIIIRSESPESTTTTTTRSQQQQQQVMQMAPMMHAPRIQAPPPPPRVYGTFDATLVRDVVNNTARPKFDLVLNREAVLREWRKRCATAAGKTGKGQDGEFDVAVFGSSDTKSNSSDCSVCTAEFGVGQTVHMMPSTRTTANTATQQQQGGDAPPLSEPTRQERIERYRQKRLRRAFSKKVRYVIRKANAERRPRFKGRFINPNTLTVGDGD
ncbi:hypothetical protein PPROV_000969800 [Pycnococcus provasolii]|uniref:CCT domain-containing protein n=1 Tax=Pycnococcus provasolii TaxID=41880 RepID=A0A830HVI0_9CHLO|nr:hypothetical protein PPROV_000969800 [Pycnococcus provasolii]